MAKTRTEAEEAKEFRTQVRAFISNQMQGQLPVAKAAETVAETLVGGDVRVAETLAESNKVVAQALLDSNAMIATTLATRDKVVTDKLAKILENDLPHLAGMVGILNTKVNLIIGGLVLIIPSSITYFLTS